MRTANRVARLAILIPLFVGMGKANAVQELYVHYQIRENPSDERSDVLWSVVLHLKESDQIDDEIGWRIKSVSIVELETPTTTERGWTEESPYVPTGDGLWWVRHGDTESPVAGEFDVTPLLYGTALALDTSDPDMFYDFKGSHFDPGPGGPPFAGDLSSSTFALKLDNEGEDPEEDGEDEEIEIVITVDPLYAVLTLE